VELCCPDCKAAWPDGRNCADAFHQALAWDFENLGAGAVHHLTVLCYHLRHPSLYSTEGLQYAKGLLVQFLENGKTPATVRLENSESVQSTKRNWPVTGTASNKGEYQSYLRWTMTIQDLVSEGLENYPKMVRAWSESVLMALRDSGNI